MAFQERGGVASVFIDGAYYEVAAQINIKLGGLIRTPKIKSDGVAGWTTKYAAPEVTLTAIDGPQTSVQALKAISGQTLQVQLNNGKVYLVYDATQIDDLEIKVADGELDTLKFSGSSADEQLAG